MWCMRDFDTQILVLHPCLQSQQPVCQPPTPVTPHQSPEPIHIAATKTIAWSTHSYKPLTLKAGTLVTFKWSGFHDVAVSKLNEKSTQSECFTKLQML